MRSPFLLFLLGLAIAASNPAAAFTIDQPSADRWMYPFDSEPGTRKSASVFGAVGETAFDDRDGQFLVRFDTSSIATPGQGAYSIQSLQLALTVIQPMPNQSFVYDPTGDSYKSRLASTSPNYVPDLDLGTPVELFAVGYRNGFSEATFQENSPFGTSGKGTRNAYAAGFAPNGTMIDVSNNVAGGFEVSPLAIGQIAGASAGDLIGDGAIMTFNIDLSNAAVVAWLQASLNSGYLEFMVTSLQATTQQATGGYPAFYTKENTFNDPTSSDPDDHLAAKLSGGIFPVPEPGTIAFLLLGLGALASLRGMRHVS